jgi:hypothetical protein
LVCEIEINSEEDILKEIRFYHFKATKKLLKEDGVLMPESSLLRVVWSLKILIQSNCKTSMEIILSHKNAESFIDEYNIRVSFIHSF